MTAKQVTIQLTSQQQHQIRIATGQSLTELNIDLSPAHFVRPVMSLAKMESAGRSVFKYIAGVSLIKTWK